jgi:hypothetical protein
MNERIKELSIKAGFPEWSNHAIEFELEQFAELIVQECISINRQRMFSEYEGDSHRVAHNNALLCATSDMFEYFGVGEQVTESSELHTCPYAEEIHNDYETLCDCDEEQTYQCARDI